MENFTQFECRVETLLMIDVSPAEVTRMVLGAKQGGIFNPYYDDKSVWTENEARKIADRILDHGPR
jgi:hypothetical protein